MELSITKPAVQWFKKEMGLDQGDFIRFFARVGGCSTVQTGYSLGVSKELPMESGLSTNVDGITFFVEEKDLWYLDGHDLTVKYQRKYEEITFDYKKNLAST
ncbi:HesB/YadR/YfhF family protein [Alkalihalobacillus sp. AL-G]|uniref:HesB/YadR/YfhF family protein n=1 Tax=Alkalihalobacillus sp. AL-G TaxID=2926399 RepID=UPI002729AE25|nr:HesB/YadR/YfhF family protein [Alkalihalobacillus sp. AL-G]WLD95282.1 HesB/YadR/YfhF family protein [Alkalihalobacillus sp. AL-G]